MIEVETETLRTERELEGVPFHENFGWKSKRQPEEEVGGGWSPLQEWEDSREPPSPPLASVTVPLDKPTEI